MNKLVVAGTLLIAFALRIFWLDSLPSGFTPDEASFGYDAYSILKTGKDQWGKPFPLVLESFGDSKAPVYTYLDIPFVFLFGLSEFSVRLPNAILGSLAVFLVYLLVLEFKKDKKKDYLKNIEFIAPLMLAVSPWHIMLSRGAFEANLTSFFLPLGILFFLKSLKRQKYIMISLTVFGINMFTYHSARFLTPIVLIVLIIFYAAELKKFKLENLLLGSLIFGVFMCTTFVTFFAGAGARVSERSVFAGAQEAAAPKRLELINKGFSPVVAKLVWNKYTEAGSRFTKNYYTYIAPEYLFKNGAGETTYGMITNHGVIYLFEAIALPVAIYFLLKSRNKSIFIVFFITLIGFIPAAMTTGMGRSANRAAFSMPWIQIFSSVGIVYLIELIKNKLVKLTSFLLSILFVVNFLNLYFYGSKEALARGMLYGNIEVANWLHNNVDSNQKVAVSKGLSEPQIFIAFTKPWPPENFQSESRTWDYKKYNVNWVDQIPIYSLNNYTFKTIEPEFDELEFDFIVKRPDKSDRLNNKVYTVFYPDGEEAVNIYKIERGVGNEKSSQRNIAK